MPKISLGKRPRASAAIRCLGIHPNWEDYSPEAQAAIRQSPEIHYPTALYENLFQALGKHTSPTNYYWFVGNKIRQTELFQLLEIPHPRTHIYHGKNLPQRILNDFTYPFVAKIPIGSSQGEGVWRIDTEPQLTEYLANHHPAYIQEFIPMTRDLRAVVINGRAVHAYWRIAGAGEFRNNVSRGATISFAAIPVEAVRFAEHVAATCRFGEVALDVCEHNGGYLVIEANMAYGLEGFRQAGLNIHQIIKNLNEEITP